MSNHVYKLIFKIDHRGFCTNEGAAFSFAEAVSLVGSGVCAVDPSEPEREVLEASVRAYRKPPSPNSGWLLPAVSRRGRILMGMFGSKQ